MRRILTTLAVVGALLYSAGAVWATSRDAVDEGARFEKYISKAENGDVDAQVTLGMMYDNGWYVAENKAEAFKWFLRAAERHDAMSQMHVGWAHVTGELVPRDLVKAHMWFLFADTQGYERAKEALDMTKKYLSSGQISEAERLAVRWRKNRED